MDMLQQACEAVPNETKLDSTRGMRKLNDVMSKLDLKDPEFEELRAIHKRSASALLESAETMLPDVTGASAVTFGDTAIQPTHSEPTKTSSSGNPVVLVD